ncbi:signal peptidase I [Salinibacterium amurskyense]|uniref:Signal peptidase I n=1 Tax=Salinibacterium amurskyense TaxID=205941 RepID=A0A2M9D8J2_9MICO|nr:signal peptidase I [Salinibacterium amurskyense]PJJ81958.1 signal peptidase I [Salinibacterium amurskyense]RLQ81747.1 signal peptidase I [Salinibacterium amurskyense]GHD78682.1 signal peptidase I [Salinibacterium amurskyense]
MTNNTVDDALPSSNSERHRAAKKTGGWKLFLRDLLIIFVAAIVISFLIKTYLVRSFYIPSSSMENTLQIDDRILVNQLEPALFPVEHGDVVVFTDPGGWLPAVSSEPENWFVGAVDGVLAFVGLSAPDSSNHLIKRVIGLPGDTVECCNEFGQIIVNGIPLEEPYILLPDAVTKATQVDFSVTVPDDSIWVMGDNRYNSADSAFHKDDPTGGFVKIDSVVGRAFLISWPTERWTMLDNYSTTFQRVTQNAE